MLTHLELNGSRDVRRVGTRVLRLELAVRTERPQVDCGESGRLSHARGRQPPRLAAPRRQEDPLLLQPVIEGVKVVPPGRLAAATTLAGGYVLSRELASEKTPHSFMDCRSRGGIAQLAHREKQPCPQNSPASLRHVIVLPRDRRRSCAGPAGAAAQRPSNRHHRTAGLPGARPPEQIYRSGPRLALFASRGPPRRGGAGNRTRVLRRFVRASPSAAHYASTRPSGSREQVRMTGPVAD